MFTKPQKEHGWLEQLVGRWQVEQECLMPDGSRSTSEMVCRMVGGLWLVSENAGESPSGERWTCLMTLGFDPQQGHYCGTFLGSMMAHLWLYQGQVDASGRRLPLLTRGPAFDGNGLANYRDTIEFVSADEWLFTGECEQENGEWQQIMYARQIRCPGNE